MFDLDQFIADCRAALAAEKTHRHVRDVVARAVAEPAAVLALNAIRYKPPKKKSPAEPGLDSFLKFGVVGPPSGVPSGNVSAP
jgi:hypothetical protein